MSASRPEPPPSAPADPRRERGGLLWHHVWTAVLGANLVLPIRIARDMAAPGGEVAMALAVGLIWIIGDLVGVRSRRARFMLTWGGLGVAFSQIYPLAQLFAGILGVGLAGWLVGLGGGEFGFPTNLSGPGAFLATFLTGVILLLIAAFLGMLILMVLRILNRILKKPLGSGPFSP